MSCHFVATTTTSPTTSSTTYPTTSSHYQSKHMLFALSNIPHEQSDKIVYLKARNFIDKLSYI